MKYISLTAGTFNALVCCLLVYIAARAMFSDELLWAFLLNAVFSVANITIWMILDFTENCRNISEMS